MMGRLKSDQGQLFYELHLSDAVPEDHLVRKIDAALDLSWLRTELAPHYSSMGRPSIRVGSAPAQKRRQQIRLAKVASCFLLGSRLSRKEESNLKGTGSRLPGS